MDKEMKFEGEIVDIERDKEYITGEYTGTIIILRVEQDESLEKADKLNHLHLGKATFSIKQYGA